MGKRVLCCGTFDHLHPGHLSFLEQAAALGDELCVVVARDENVRRIKGHYPDEGQEVRLAKVAALEWVDEALLGHPGTDLLKIVGQIRPDLIALGYDQKPPARLRERFPACRIVVLQSHHPEKYKSSLIRQKNAAP